MVCTSDHFFREKVRVSPGPRIPPRIEIGAPRGFGPHLKGASPLGPGSSMPLRGTCQHALAQLGRRQPTFDHYLLACAGPLPPPPPRLPRGRQSTLRRVGSLTERATSVGARIKRTPRKHLPACTSTATSMGSTRDHHHNMHPPHPPRPTPPQPQPDIENATVGA